MRPFLTLGFLLVLGGLAWTARGAEAAPANADAQTNAPTAATILAASQPADWRRPDPENLLCIELPRGRVVIELAPFLAPRHVANVRALVRERYFDGLSILRVQDNYVVGWGDPEAGQAGRERPIREARRHLPAELEFRPTAVEWAAYTRLPDPDSYAPETGFLGGFPVARDPATGVCWPVHSYGMVGAGREDSIDSGGGPEMYVVIGQAPRHLDRNVTLFGRVIRGMELFASLPRGTAAMGFYEKPSERIPLRSVRLASDLPPEERPGVEILRTDTATFRQWIEARRNRREPWFHRPAGRIDVSNVPIPTR